MKTELKNIPIEELKRGQFQTRKQFADQELQELAESIRSCGLIQPIVVRPTANSSGYEIVAGERRWRAAQIAGLDLVPCLVRAYSDEQAGAATTIENINRVDLNPIEEAEAYEQLLQEFQYTHEELAVIVGKSRAKITNILRLLKLEPRVQQWLIEGKLSEGHGKMLAGLLPRQQLELAEKTLDLAWSVRRLEQEVRKLQDLNGSLSSSKDPNLKKLEQQISEQMGCKVNLELEQQRAKMVVDFHNLEILEGLLEKLGIQTVL